jgi:hypothetical protein
VKEFADTLKSFGVSRIHGDRYAGEWPREAFRKCGVEYRVADKTKSDLYLALLPLLNSGRVELLDHKTKIVSPLFVSKQAGWIGAGAENTTGKSATQLFYEHGGYGGGSYWPGSGPKDW